jgi:hypothetical protein
MALHVRSYDDKISSILNAMNNHNHILIYGHGSSGKDYVIHDMKLNGVKVIHEFDEDCNYENQKIIYVTNELNHVDHFDIIINFEGKYDKNTNSYI